MPTKYTCDGENVSPPLIWKNPPQNTASFVLIVDEPDTHHNRHALWIVYNISPDINHLAENFSNNSWGFLQGRNSFGHLHYDGPCLFLNENQGYHFRLYAVDKQLPRTRGLTQADVLAQVQQHTLAFAELIGTYSALLHV
jgi:Raf kinase inhibitor-like YbhB/YbcL family protein